MSLSDTFPDDILIEILCRLPVKSLVRFRRVSESWQNLISSPHFVKLHLNLSIQNNPKILFSSCKDSCTIDYQTGCYDPKPYYDFPVYAQFFMGSCNGLLCFYVNDDYMCLWNPATKEDKFTIPPASAEDETLEEREVVVGFGYDPVVDEYKIVRCIFFFREDYEDIEFHECEVNVCTLGSGEWRTIGNPPCFIYNLHMTPLVNGALHWLGGSNSVEHKIISFDIRTEQFCAVPWMDTSTNTNVTIAGLQGCLSALVSHGDDRQIGVWTMKDYGVKESWTKLFSIQMPPGVEEFSSIEPLVLRENGEMILKSWGELYTYDGTDHTLSATYNIYDDSECCYAGHIYAESIVSIESLVC